MMNIFGKKKKDLENRVERIDLRYDSLQARTSSLEEHQKKIKEKFKNHLEREVELDQEKNKRVSTIEETIGKFQLALDEVGYQKKFGTMKKLSKREEQVLTLLKKGMAQANIAKQIPLSQQRVSDICKAIRKKGHKTTYFYPITSPPNQKKKVEETSSTDLEDDDN